LHGVESSQFLKGTCHFPAIISKGYLQAFFKKLCLIICCFNKQDIAATMIWEVFQKIGCRYDYVALEYGICHPTDKQQLYFFSPGIGVDEGVACLFSKTPLNDTLVGNSWHDSLMDAV